MMRSTLTVATLFSLLAGASSLHGQEWTVDASAGRALYGPLSASPGTSNAALGLRYAGIDGGWFYVSAAAPLTADDPLWGVAGLGRRFLFGQERMTAGVDVGVHGHAYRDPIVTDPGTGATLEALPFVALESGPARVELRSGLIRYASAFAGESAARTVHDSGVRLDLGWDAPFVLSGEARYVRAEEDDYAYFGGSAAIDHGRAGLWAAAGHWFSDAIPDFEWGVGARYVLNARASFWASVRRDASDPIYWNGERRSWSLGVSHRIGPAEAVKAPLPPAPGPALEESGPVVIRIPRSEAVAAPFIAGDFNGWDLVPMALDGEFWVVRLSLEPGVYLYAFRWADGDWFVPESVPGRRDDGMGGFVAVLVVP